MKILILGGTRFIGRQVAKTLVVKGHDLILLSHRKDSALHNVRHVCEKRDVGLWILKGERFNLVLDFICYDKKDLEKIESKIKDVVNECVTFAEESPYPSADEVYKDVYADADYPYIIE